MYLHLCRSHLEAYICRAIQSKAPRLRIDMDVQVPNPSVIDYLHVAGDPLGWARELFGRGALATGS